MAFQHFVDFFHFKKYSDDFWYAGDIWHHEINKWLALLCALDQNFYEQGKTRVSTPKQRDEFLGEAKSIYYCHKFLGGNNFKLEPSGRNNKKLDFAYEKDNETFLVEVKSPSWLGEIWKNDSLTTAQKQNRKQQPQYIDEGGSFGPINAIEDSIKNALPKFEKNQNNVLIIAPNMKVPIHRYPSDYLQKIVENELDRQDPDQLISGVAILEEFSNNKKEIEYRYKLIAGTH